MTHLLAENCRQTARSMEYLLKKLDVNDQQILNFAMYQLELAARELGPQPITEDKLNENLYAGEG